LDTNLVIKLTGHDPTPMAIVASHSFQSRGTTCSARKGGLKEWVVLRQHLVRRAGDVEAQK
jgi:hypothetical protein